MRKIILITSFICLCLFGWAQNEPHPLRRLCIEPAIGLRLGAAFGPLDVQASVLVQQQLNRRFSLVSHTAVSFDINNYQAFQNINVKRSVTSFQKVGIGASVHNNRSSHALFLIAGGKHFSYSASVDNPSLEDTVKTNFNTFAWDSGLLYNLKIGRRNTYFSGRIYAPIFDGKWNLLENASTELGFGVKIK